MSEATLKFLDLSKKIILLDRDGVINHDCDTYIKSPEEWHPIAGSLEAIALLYRSGFKIFVITNQSGLGRKLFNHDTLNAIHQKMASFLLKHGGEIEQIIYCPHTPQAQCQCRKPLTGMPDTLAKRFKLDFTNVPFVGDTTKDLGCAAGIGATGVLVRSGKGADTESQLLIEKPDYFNPQLVYENLFAAVNDWLQI